MKIKIKDLKNLIKEELYGRRMGTMMGPAAAYDKSREPSSTQYASVPSKRMGDPTLGGGRENLNSMQPEYIDRLARKIMQELKKLNLKKDTIVDVLHKVLSSVDQEFEE